MLKIKKKIKKGGKVKRKTVKKTYSNLTCKDLITLEEFKKYLVKPNPLVGKFMLKRQELFNIKAILYKTNRYKIIEQNLKDRYFIHANNSLNAPQLYEMLISFIGLKHSKIVLGMIEQQKSDTVILNYIKSTHTYRGDDRIFYILTKVADKILKYTKEYTNKPIILDVGCGSGKIIDSEIYGVDIPDWGPYRNNRKSNKNFTYKTVSTKPYHIDFKDTFFDCIILMLTLHHVDNIITVINECKRMLKKTGIIIIIEHDVWTDDIDIIIDLQHTIYQTVNNETLIPRGCYYNYLEWDIVFDKCGLEPLYADSLNDNITNTLRYDLQFIGIYKIKN